MNSFQINSIGADDEEMLQLGFKISSNAHTTTVTDWLYPDSLLNFAQDLQKFPQNIEHEVKFEIGGKDAIYYVYMLFRIFVFNRRGHAVFEVETIQNLIVPFSASAHFFILCEPATINQLGKALTNWIQNPDSSFSFSWTDWHDR